MITATKLGGPTAQSEKSNSIIHALKRNSSVGVMNNLDKMSPYLDAPIEPTHGGPRNYKATLDTGRSAQKQRAHTMLKNTIEVPDA